MDKKIVEQIGQLSWTMKGDKVSNYIRTQIYMNDHNLYTCQTNHYMVIHLYALILDTEEVALQ